MGWTTTYKPKGEPVLDFFVRQGVFTWSSDRSQILAAEIVSRPEAQVTVFGVQAQRLPPLTTLE